MDTSGLPLEITNFLTDYVESIGHLEVILLLHSYPNKEWNAEDLSRELRSNVTSATTKLQQLLAKGLINISSSNKFIYSPSAELDLVITRLQGIYLERPVAVVTFIYEKPADKLKGFADAFKFKKD